MVATVLKPTQLQPPFFHNNPLPCLLLQEGTLNIVAANAAASAFFNSSARKLEAANFSDFLIAPDADVYGLLKKCGSQAQPLVFSFKTATGPATAQVFVSNIAATEPLLGLMLMPDTAHGKENENFLAAMVNETSDVLTLADLAFKPVIWSKAAERLYGITSEQAIGRKISSYITIKYHNISKEEVRERARTAGAWRGEMSFVRPSDGKTVTLLTTFKLINNKAGQPQHYVISGTDITEQKQTETRLRETEKKLQESEAFYRTLITDSVDGKLLTMADGTITFASPSLQYILGYVAEDLTGRNVFEFVHPDDHLVARTAFQNELLQTPKVKFIEVRILKKDRTWLWCSVRGHNLLANPHISRMVIALHDHTQRKQATDALKESEQRFRALIKDLKLGVTLQNAEGKLVMFNKATADLFQVDEATLESANLYELFKKAVHENETPFASTDLPMVRAARMKQPVEDVVIGLCMKNTGARTWLLVNANPVLDEGGNIRHLITSFTDVTEHKKLTQRLLEERLNQQRLLTQATIDGQERERKEIGKELHDNIGQQLATAKLYLDLVKTAPALNAGEMLDRATRSIADIINEVRTISHSLVPPTLGDLGLVESVHDLMHTIGLVQNLQVCFEHEGFNEAALPENGKLMLYRIIQEALNNIVKHAQATAVHINLTRRAGTIELHIQDNGQGFESGKTRNGLGLRNIRNRAELFGGTLLIHATPGAGCAVQVVVPDLLRLCDGQA